METTRGKALTDDDIQTVWPRRDGVRVGVASTQDPDTEDVDTDADEADVDSDSDATDSDSDTTDSDSDATDSDSDTTDVTA